MDIYRVCSGNTTLDIGITFTQGTCDFYQSVWQNYYENRYWRVLLTVNLSQASPIPFTYNFLNQYVILKNGFAYSSGEYINSITIPAGVTEYSWYETCQTILGEVQQELQQMPQQI